MSATDDLDITVIVNPAAYAELASSDDARAGVRDVGDQVARLAAYLAPKRTGAGAASIHAEMVVDDAVVSWDRLYDYMRFQEDGTKYVRAKHFLKHAAESM
ncbi:MAG TPA: hypothetical protein VF054_06650 [Micromonosporaceae bacterium]